MGPALRSFSEGGRELRRVEGSSAKQSLYYSVLNDLDTAAISVIVNFFYCAKYRNIFLDEKAINLV